jgi:hypothetical protein
MLKTEAFVEYDGKQIAFKDLEKIAKEQWVSDGGLVKDMKTLNLYFKPYESACFMVVNGDDKGSFQI